MNSWNDFNDASRSPNQIPRGTFAKVRLSIRPGGYDDPEQGWTGGIATRGVSGAVYLSCEFTVIEGPYSNRKIFNLIGLFSPKGPDWADQGRSLIRSILSSARGVSARDTTPEGRAARRIAGFADLNGLEFAARIDVGTDASGMDTNEIRVAVTPDHRQYAAIMGTALAIAAPPATFDPAALRPSWTPPRGQ
jgi:hypothetical protein